MQLSKKIINENIQLVFCITLVRVRVTVQYLNNIVMANEV